MIDAPVSGSVSLVEQGKLSVMVGGDRATFDRVKPLLEDIGKINLKDIHWVIVGGESGYGARTMAEPWVESLRDQCRHARVAFFFKQWGGVRKHKTGRLLNGLQYDELPVLN